MHIKIPEDKRLALVDTLTWLFPKNTMDALRIALATGGVYERHDFSSAAGQWTANHSIGRVPEVSIYSSAGEILQTDVIATNTQVVVTFANPTSGFLILT